MKYDARIRKIETAIYQIAGNAAIIVYPDREEQTDLLDYYLNLIYASAKGEIPGKPKGNQITFSQRGIFSFKGNDRYFF